MKKFLALLLAMMLILSSFAACGSNDEGESADPGVNAGQDVEAGGELEDDAEGEADEEGTAEEDADKEEEKEEAADKQEEQTPADKPSNSEKPSNSGNTSSSTGKSEAKAPSGTPAEIIDMINKKAPAVEFPLGTIEIDINDADALKMFTGLSSADKITGAAASEAMMGSQAYSLVVVKVKDAKNAETVLEEMVNGIDQRKWICVEADDLSAAAVGDVVVLMMVDSEYADTITSKDVIDAFSGICGGLDARV